MKQKQSKLRVTGCRCRASSAISRQNRWTWYVVLLLVCTLLLPASAWAQTPPSPTPTPSAPADGGTRVDYKADKVEYHKAEGYYRLSGHVDLHVRDIEIKTEELEYDFNKKILRSKVPFEMIQTPKDSNGPRRLKGRSFAYYVDLRRIEAMDVYLVVPAKAEKQEVYIQGDSMTAYNDGQRVVMHNGFFTTCNHFESQVPENMGDGAEDPYSRKAVSRRTTHYAVEGEVMDYIDNDRLLVWNAQILTFENPAFWFPFWYVPLQSLPNLTKPDIDAGQNAYEGIFAKFKGYYHWNDYHDGYWYVSVMEKKGVGLGFQHDWIAAPNSISSLYFYGLPITTNIQGLGSLFTLPDLTGQASAQLQTLQAQTASSPLDVVSQWLSNKFQDHDIQFQHKQLILPHMEAFLKYTDKNMYGSAPGYTPDRNAQHVFDLSMQDSEIFPLDRATDLAVDTTLSMNQTGANPIKLEVQPDRLSVKETRTTTQNQTRNAVISAHLGQSNLTLNSGWNNSSSQTSSSIRTLASSSPSPSASPAQSQVNQQPPTGTETWNNTLNFTAPIDEKTNLTLNLALNSNTTGIGNAQTPQGSLEQTLKPNLTINQTHDWGSIGIVYDDFLDLSPNKNAITSGQLKKLPEINLNFNPLFQNTFPIQFSSVVGRYLEPGSTLTGPKDISEISRTKFQLSLGSKELDLGLGNKVNFSGTSFDQRFYQTLDAEYRMTGSVSLRNDLSKYFSPQLTYSRTISDPDNHSPFKNLDPLALSENNLLNVNLNLVNLPEFTMTVTGGYDYLSRQYQPIRANIVSEIGKRFSFRFNTGYSIANIKDADVGQLLKDSRGNVYHHGDPVNGQTFRVKPEDVGSFNPYGGTWDISTLGMHWRTTDYDIVTNNLSTFGLDEGVPEGLDLGAAITYNFDQGKLDNITGQLKWVIGSNWQWHTEFDVTITARPGTQAGTGPTDWQTLEIPFNIAVRKDLHDFILSASWDSFYQQFNVNLQLLAFPNISTSSLLGNVNSLSQQVNQLSPGGIR